MAALAVVVGLVLVVAVLADLINTLITTTTSRRRWCLTLILYRRTWSVIRAIAAQLPSESAKEALLGIYAPVSVLLLLAAWVAQQVVGFGLIWWGLAGVDGADGLSTRSTTPVSSTSPSASVRWCRSPVCPASAR